MSDEATHVSPHCLPGHYFSFCPLPAHSFDSFELFPLLCPHPLFCLVWHAALFKGIGGDDDDGGGGVCGCRGSGMKIEADKKALAQP